jgi:endonuclease/exonuclease/phosphatase family metal-dependent hydrolase
MPFSFTLTTWNVQNLFRPDGPAAADPAVYDAKIQLLAQVMAQLDPDVIALQEVGDEGSLADLQQARPAYAHRWRGVEDSRGIACAFLSKLPFDDEEDIVDFPPAVLELGIKDIGGEPLTRMGRGALRVRVSKNGFTCDLINVHLKSKLLTFPGGFFSTRDEVLRAKVAGQALMRRTAEAATVRIAASALAEVPATAVAVLGDFNDEPAAATTQIFQGPEGSELMTRGFDRPDQGDDVRLWNLAWAIAEPRRFSRVHRGQPELLDQIFVSEEFFPPGDDDLRRLPLSVDALVDNITSIGDNPNTSAAQPRPDHAPVTAAFEFL